FINPTVDELNEVFDKFLTKGVNNLILDLRYNGGGSVTVAHTLANQICGSKANGALFLTQEHNQNSTSHNKTLYLKAESNSLMLNNLVVIATDGTASASELIISGLKPHMNVTVVGDKTYGKPVGMYSLIYPQFNWAFVPICFRFVNSQGFSDYYGGIPADIEADDNIRVPFGSITESSLSAALNHLGYITTKTSATPTKARLNVGKGLYEEIGSW
ncbi:MAG TPA: S41 family peptidase, partial [Tenuifilaceae bacterium]|nr:S41 family peptidase [Tenuifilaceae bacterium]